MSRFGDIATGVSHGAGELGSAFTSRREELMRGDVDKLWTLTAAPGRVFLSNVSRDIWVQEAWFTDASGQRQALGPIRPGEHSEIRALRSIGPQERVTGRVEWRVRSMLLPWRSIHRSGQIDLVPRPVTARH